MSVPRPRRLPASSIRARATAGLLVLPAVVLLGTVRPLQATRTLARIHVLLAGGRPFSSPTLLLQETLRDCGPTALHNLLLTLEVPSPGPAVLARTSGTRMEGTSMGGLVRSARRLGVPLRARRVPASRLPSLTPPFLAWLGEGHFVTVLAVEDGGWITVHDPGVGGYRLPLRAFGRRFGGAVADLPSGGSPPRHSLRVPREGPGTHFPFHRRSP